MDTEKAMQADETNLDPRLEQANKLFQTGVMLIYGRRKSIDKAIKCIQKAITFNDSDYKFWQLLGEAYYQRGSLNPAINCFLKSLKLVEDAPQEIDNRRQSDCIYSRLRMSDIRLSVGHFDEAALGYLDIINTDPNNAAAIVGYSRTELQLAKNDFSNGLIVSGNAHCMKALQYSLKAIKLCPHLCTTWKLASDCCLTQFIHGQRGHFERRIYEKLIDDEDEDDFIVVNRLTCVEMAQKFICKALTIEKFQDSGCLWHNLGLSLYLKSSLIENEDQRREILKRSMKCLLKGLDTDRDSSQLKNTIGVVAFHLNLLNSAQNFLIKSIRSNMSTSEIQFSNLGYMYTQKGEFRLAGVAFNRCQAEEPLYARSWLGNALICEEKNEDNLTYLRHCHKLDNNYEPQLTYASKVTTLPCTLNYKKDLVNALDSMKRTINYLPISVEACNTLSLLYERSKYSEQARICIERAYKTCKTDSRVIFNRLRQHSALKSCHTDRLKGPQPDAEFIKTAERIATSSGNKEYMLNFIYYLFNNGDYRNVDFELTKLLNKLPQEDIRAKVGAQILLGLANKAENEDYKSWLFKNIVDSEDVICLESLINLICLMLLGSTSGDQQLIDQTSNDLLRYLIRFITTRSEQFTNFFEAIEGQWIRLAIFISIFCLKDPGKLIRPILALYPTVAELWLYLGLSLMFDNSKYQVATNCIKKAQLIGSSCADLSVICDILLAILAKTSKTKPNGTLDMQLKHLSRAIYKYPHYQLLWQILKQSTNPAKLRQPAMKDQLLNDEQNSSLFNLAIDHTIKMVTA